MDSRGKVFRRRLSAGSRLRAARGIERSEHLRAVRSCLTLGLPSITQIEGAQIGVIDGLSHC